jgi:FMN phosphatase YigB (HAD superfamily)
MAVTAVYLDVGETLAAARRPAREVAYVGDRVDNDRNPALEAGWSRSTSGAVRRGHIQPGRERADVRTDFLDELPAALS